MSEISRKSNENKNKKIAMDIAAMMPDDCKEYYKSRCMKVTGVTLVQNFRILRDFLRFVNGDKNDENLKNIDLKSITITDIEGYLESKMTKKIHTKNGVEEKFYSDSYYNAIVFALKRFFEFLYNRKKIDERIFEEIQQKKNNDFVEKKRMTKKDVKNILAELIYDIKRIDEPVITGLDSAKDEKEILTYMRALKHNTLRYRDHCILSLLFCSGLRVEECFLLDIKDINFTKSTLFVIGKGQKRFNVDLPEELMDIIDTWLEKRKKWKEESLKYNKKELKDEPALFINVQNGNRLTAKSIRDLCKKYTSLIFKDECGYDAMPPHQARHFFAQTLYYSNGKDILSTQKAMRHSSPQTTLRYIESEGDWSTGVDTVACEILG